MPIPDQLPLSASPVRQLALDPMEEARKRLIVALDVPSAKAATELVSRLENSCKWFKVGLELFVATGPKLLESLTAGGHSVFLDLKFHDIPNTVAGAVRSAARLGVRMMTVHASGGPEMLKTACEALDGVTDPPELLAVTVLTSMNAAELKSTGVVESPAEQAVRLARVGMDAGFRGFVCSPQEVASLRTLTGPEGVLVIPGIRPAGAEIGDQKRIATPAEALRLGASFLVVGRPITQAANPAEAAEAILRQMSGALAH
ncbi:MAG: orotidine-5'-phosphate decarboxylase [Terracidiphilus sp.]